eukprot:Plantae.Rhodophyta-Rhodochaete_pulchella.ctg17096.p1 GENE.Plantae.Rhodophyta-Rhodochaete_pulchella.ctg17096~~Plantae.Rhodophyta-Rhodochaete_pulchella.ctg17096.p1  ORF type:complete len:171 (-),score=26.34 Plantae.Rhodophyta-Rhodochaete_pulchella.ctg17096:226-738(-)
MRLVCFAIAAAAKGDARGLYDSCLNPRGAYAPRQLDLRRRGRSRRARTLAAADGDGEEGIERAEDMLARDLARMKNRRKQEKAAETDDDALEVVAGKAKGVLDTLLVWNFGLVMLFLGWFIVGLVLHYAARNDTILDPWFALWPNVIQPVLGVLMLATILSGTASSMQQK